MKAPFFERLTSLDHSFLVFEGPMTPMHVAATAILEPGSFANPEGGIDVGKVKSYVASRLHLTPEYRRCLATIPIENHPVWVDDQHFDLDYHIRQSSLPRPGNRAQLQELCARLLERPLDRSRPLWEMWVIEGLADGRFALLMKIHHCLVDGVAGVSLMAALFSLTPETTIEAPQPWRPRPLPSGGQLLEAEWLRRAKMTGDALRSLKQSAREPRETARAVGRRLSSTLSFLRSGLRASSGTPWGSHPGGHRRIRWMELDLNHIKEVKNAFGGTINDVVLTTVTGAVQRFFRHRGVGIQPGSFKVGVPVNVRAAEAKSERGNHVWMWLLPLPTEFSDARDRFDAVHHDAEELKQSQQAAVGELVTQAIEWTSANLLPVGIRLIQRLQPFDILVTNVPGPPLPLYMLDAPIADLYPHVPLFEGQSVAIALFSYAGRLLWAVNADWDTVPDVDVFVDSLRLSFAELHRAARKERGGWVQRQPTRRLGGSSTHRRSRSPRAKMSTIPPSETMRTG